MELVEKLSKSFWSEYFWLPHNVTWKDVEPGSKKDVVYNDYRHLLWPIPISVVIIIARYFIERYLIAPVGKYLGVKSIRSKPPAYNKLLEDAYKKSQNLIPELIKVLENQSMLTKRQIERWWRLRKAQDRQTTIVKFCESGWGLIYFSFSFSFGMILVWDKPWLLDTNHLWKDYPHQSISCGMWWLYMIMIGFYLSLMFTQFYDVRRKDFCQMFIHHVVALMLFNFSWICNLHRAALLISIVHDFGDIPLNIAKCLKYANRQKACEIVFGIFVVVWILTRLIIFPRIIYSVVIEFPRIIDTFPIYNIIISLLILLLILHLLWTYAIIQSLIKCIQVGKMDRDVRSSSDDDNYSESTETPKVKLDFQMSP